MVTCDMATSSREAVTESATKTCPQCGQELFEDMDICYGCLYDFSRNDPLSASVISSSIPEVEEDDLESTGIIGMCDSVSAGIPIARSPRLHVDSDQTGLHIFVQTSDVDVTIPLPTHGIMVGRMPTCDVVLHSRAISREHVAIVPTKDGALVRDCGATNPVILRGREVVDNQHMNVGDVLNVCGALLTLVEGYKEQLEE